MAFSATLATTDNVGEDESLRCLYFAVNTPSSRVHMSTKRVVALALGYSWSPYRHVEGIEDKFYSNLFMTDELP